jgi:thiamine biosynthesis lipoprotein
VYILLSLSLVVACGKPDRLPEFELSGGTMGTSFSIKLVAPPDSLSREDLGLQIGDLLQWVEQLTSTYLVGSELSAFNTNRSTDWIAVSSDLCEVIESALDVSRLTNGAFDITIGPLVNLWGFGPDGVVLQPPSESEITAAMSRVGHNNLETRCADPAVRKSNGDLYIDLSGWAKGYAADELATVLEEHGLEDYLVEIGGELRARGNNAEGRKWAVAVEKPVADERALQTVLRLTDCGIATSGDYRNFFDYDGIRYSHTIDARTGRPVSHALAAVTVIHDSAAFADAMATALLVLGPEAGPALAQEFGVAAYFLVRGDTVLEELTTPYFDIMVAQ